MKTFYLLTVILLSSCASYQVISYNEVFTPYVVVDVKTEKEAARLEKRIEKKTKKNIYRDGNKLYFRPSVANAKRKILFKEYGYFKNKYIKQIKDQL